MSTGLSTNPKHSDMLAPVLSLQRLLTHSKALKVLDLSRSAVGLSDRVVEVRRSCTSSDDCRSHCRTHLSRWLPPTSYSAVESSARRPCGPCPCEGPGCRATATSCCWLARCGAIVPWSSWTWPAIASESSLWRLLCCQHSQHSQRRQPIDLPPGQHRVVVSSDCIPRANAQGAVALTDAVACTSSTPQGQQQGSARAVRPSRARRQRQPGLTATPFGNSARGFKPSESHFSARGPRFAVWICGGIAGASTKLRRWRSCWRKLRSKESLRGCFSDVRWRRRCATHSPRESRGKLR